MLGVTVLVATVALALLLPTLSDTASLIRIGLTGRKRSTNPGDEVPGILFLVAAHDEERLIGHCLESLQRLDYEQESFDVVVVADNCSDGTETVVRGMGVECLVRSDPEQAGKPYAIAWGIQQLDLSRFDALVIVDADTVVDHGFCKALGRVRSLRTKAVQTFNGVSNPDDNATTRMASVLSAALYRFTYPLKQAAGLNVPLTGAGMCVGAEVLREHGWRAYSIGEDVEMYVRLSLEGVRIECVPDAVVRSEEARSLKTGSSQRQRWRAGRLTVLGQLGGSILMNRRLDVHQRLDIVAELVSPGPVVHLAVAGAFAGLVIATAPPAAGLLLLGLLLGLLRTTTYTVLAITADEQPYRALRAFLSLPGYLLRRSLTEVRAIAMTGSKRWIRTARHGDRQ